MVKAIEKPELSSPLGSLPNGILETKSAVVIGSGIAGLAAAIRLAARGYSVDVYEANDYPGGKLREKRTKGYRFDMGPSVFTMPHLIDELFTLCGRNPRDYFTYTQLDRYFQYFFEDGTIINGYANVDKLAQELTAKSKDPESSFRKYVKNIEAKFKITNGVFIENSLHILKNYLTKRVLYGILNFHRIDAFKSMYSGNKKFFKDRNLVQLFNHYASYVGSNPLVAPATLNLISHLVIEKGTFIPDKGMYSIVQALVKLAEEMGVKFHYNSLVDQILVKNKKAVGVRTVHGEQFYDIVVSNMDIYHTYHKLLPDQKKPMLTLGQPKSSSILGFYWGVKAQHDNLGVHNMLFSGDEQEEYKAVFDRHTISDDPSVYICVTAKHVKGDAPAGCENWFIIVTAPNNSGQNWNELVESSRKKVFAKVKRLLNIDLPDLIEVEEVLTPPMIEEKYRSAFGAVYGNSSNGKFAAFLRHPNFSRKIQGLYFVGGSVHPGAGIPMCLNSAKIFDKVLK
jgi:phytoene desaturase